MSADEYGFRPLPGRGLSGLQWTAVLAVIVVVVLSALTIALSGQLTAEHNRLDKLWTAPYEWPDRYHLSAANEDGETWDIWFEAPGSWRVQSPTSLQVSDGATVTTYRPEGNFYLRNPINNTYLQAGVGPLGPRDPDELKRLLDGTGAGWSVTHAAYLGRDVDVIRIGRGEVGGSGYVRVLILDPARMVLLRESIGEFRGTNETYIEATSIDYDVTAPDGTFVFTPPPGSCLKPSSTAPCSP